ncbi:MAG: glycosyltransferase family 39 protein [Candidatus Hydrogenedentota bacterium]
MTEGNNGIEANPSARSKTGPYWVALLCLLCLLPFINKAFHIDDMVYFHPAQQIHENPFDPFGFKLITTWMYDISKNPPGHSYYLAGMALIFGWSEIAMHTSMLLASICAALGIYQLARRFCEHPLLATAISVLTPAFVVSNSNIMCEPLLLVIYVWALVLWIRGMDANDSRVLALAAIILGFGILTKYIVITAIPLLIAYSIARERRLSTKLLFFVIPCLMLALYDLSTFLLYDRSSVLDVIRYSTKYSTGQSGRFSLDGFVIGLTFLGGSYLSTLFFVPNLLKPRSIIRFAVLSLFVAGVMLVVGGFDTSYLMYDENAIRWSFVLQTSIFVSAGIVILAMTVLDVVRTRDADSLLLLLLVFGIFIFTIGVNWTINTRTLIPLLPAIGILVVRRLEQTPQNETLRFASPIPFALAALLTMSVAWGDYRHSADMREAANRFAASKPSTEGQIWFEGRSGYRFYMEQNGYSPLILDAFISKPAYEPVHLSDIGVNSGDMIVIYTSQKTLSIPAKNIASTSEVSISKSNFISTMNTQKGAGFYDAHQGPLPYYFGPAAGKSYTVYTIR